MIVITDYLDDQRVEENIASEFNIPVVIQTEINGQEAQQLAVRAALVWHATIDQKFFEKFKNCEVVVRYGIGLDTIDLEFCRNHGVRVHHVVDYGIEEVADTTIGFILNLTRNISAYHSSALNLWSDKSQNGIWQEKTSSFAKRSSETTVGILGLGRMGTAVANKLRAIGFRVCFFDPYLRDGIEKSLNIDRVWSLGELARRCDVVTLHLPLNQETYGIIDKAFISMMKQGSILINSARGGLVESDDLLAASFENGRLGGLAIDTLIEEPPKPTNKLMKLAAESGGRIIINPHTAYFSEAAFNYMRERAAWLACKALKEDDFEIGRVI